ncbi:hypothetical protein MATL_G00198570 [Megalops atlanticus]|uniref:Pyrin domain-containing protein n=1 Tax=Megalops atlanticus TaxID=7932 RepID=A0A9D3PM38_MEGAT|nr:hypothetical protein MATL_G00198570 [Megalops atlanticus]
MSAVWDLLLRILEELVQSELKCFTFHLSGDDPEVCPRIPRGLLQSGDRTDIMTAMRGHYGRGQRAAEVTRYILRKMDRNDLAERLADVADPGDTRTPRPGHLDSVMKRIQEKLKINLKKRSERIYEGTDRQGVSVLLKSIYTEVYMTDGGSGAVSNEHEWSALVFVLLMSEEVQDVFDLKQYTRSDEGLLRLLPVVKRTQTALLNQCNLTEQCCEVLASTVSSVSCSLRILDLSGNDLRDVGAKLLFAALGSPDCRLETLRLSRCSLTDDSCESLALALQSASSHLMELDLSSNEFSGVGPLSDALTNPSCKLEQLDLSCNDLTDAGLRAICAGLRSQHCRLKRLHLGCISNLGDSGGKPSRDWPASPPTKQRKLVSGPSDTRTSGVRVLSDALMSPQCKLQQLHLRCNSLGDAGVQLLCSGLTSPPCRLRRLDLCGNSLKETGVQALSCVLTSPGCQLEQMDLSGNNISDAGAKTLSDALKSPNCKLQSLDLSCNHLGDSVEDPSCVFATHDGECRIKPGLQKYACSLTPDLNTMYRYLALSEGKRKITRGEEEQPYPDHPERVGVHLDQRDGMLSFYSVSADGATLLHTFYATFTQPLYAGFWIVSDSSVYLCQPE